MKEIEQYFESLMAGDGKSPHTLRAYRSTLNKLIEHFHIENIDQIKALTRNDFISFYEKCGSGNTLNTHIRNLSAFFHWLYEEEDYPHCAFAKAKLGGKKFVKVPDHKKPVLSHEESVALIKAADNIQDKFMLALMLTTALRRDEVGKIKLSDITNCYIKIHGKGNKERVTKLDETLCTMLNIYMAQRNNDSEYLFYGTRGVQNGQLSGTSVNNRVHRCINICIQNGQIDPEKGKKITAHRLRGTVLTEVAREYGIYAAQQLAGHESIETTKLYLEDGDKVTESVIDKRSGIFAEALN
jgi:integrase/recombinase XerC